MLLRRFTDERERLFVFDKRFPEKGVLTSTPRQAFSENYLYLRYANDGSRDYSIEQALGRIEGIANEIIEKVVLAAWGRKCPDLTRMEKESWDQYFLSQWRRVPDVYPSEQVVDDDLSQIVDDLKGRLVSGRLSTKALEHFLADKSMVSQIKQNARAGVAVTLGEEALNILESKGLCIAIITSSKRSFVIGSNPIAKSTPLGRTHLADPEVYAWLPIAHDVAITPALSRGQEELVEARDKGWVRRLNEATFNQSTAIAGRSRRLVESLARKMLAGSN